MVSATNQAGRRGLTFLNPTTRETHAYAGTVLDARVATNASFQFVFAAVTDASQIVHLVAGKFHGDGSDFYDLVPTEIAATTNPQRLRVAGTSVGAAYAWQMGPAGQEEIVAFSDTSSP